MAIDGMRWVLGALVFAAAAHGQDATVYLRCGDAAVRLVGPDVRELRGPLAAAAAIGPGDYRVHFAPDALGKPESLHFAVPDGAVVTIATEPAGAVVGRPLPVDEDVHDYRISARVAAGSASACGLVARRIDDRQLYRFVWDRAGAELRLERQLGGPPLVLARRPVAPADVAGHDLALQVEGFSVRAFCDHALVLHEFDGALPHGGAGTWQEGGDASWSDILWTAPARPRASCALVASGGATAAEFVAATGLAAGYLYAVQWSLDRPGPLVPATEAGAEPWLLLRPAAPIVIGGDWRAAFAVRGVGEVGRDGTLRAELHWPDVVALRRQAVLVGAVLASPSGENVVGQTPRAALWL